eukprot:TRINITY_DN93367_c0_g1_i1.p1 TRINITY_DN93367_c0_g1~~TRINITY_DN93367_c0_g1_i1.p1  ORF type:complete len:245 (+),score=59.98 TRINITY_DN93367_c0_g1_i1:53-787(+)
MSAVKAPTWVSVAAGAAAGVVLCSLLSRKRSDDVDIVEKAVVNRRSMFLQDLNGESAADEDVMRMLEAANWAPTHGLTQPWRFSVFRRSTQQLEAFFKLQLDASEAWIQAGNVPAEAQGDLKKFITKQPKKKKDIAKCSHVVAISMKRQANAEKKMPEWEEVAAVSCAVQNAHIVACQLGVAAYWSSGGTEGPLATEEVRKLLELEDGDRCLGLLYIGKADAGKWEKSRERATRGPINEKTAWH